MIHDCTNGAIRFRLKKAPVSAKEITEEEELIEFMEKWKNGNISGSFKAALKPN